MTKTGQYKQQIAESPSQSSVKGEPQSIAKARPFSRDLTGEQTSQGSAVNVDFLKSLLQATFFFDYFEYVANKTYRGDNLELKVVKLKTVHPNMYDACMLGDYVIRLVAAFGLIGLALFGAFKLIS